jgi:hypothetical protein
MHFLSSCKTIAAMNTVDEKKQDPGNDAQNAAGQKTPLHEYSHKGKKIISDRIAELSSEWDVERTLLLNAAVISVTGALLGAFVNKKWFALSALAGFVLAEQAITGWSPPAAIMQKLGKRTRDEISRERFGLKAMKGDFKNTDDPSDVWNASE